MENIRFAVVGFGRIGRRHATIIDQMSGAELVAVIEPNSDQLRSDLLPNGVSTFGSLEEYFNSVPKVDVISVCTPNAFHTPYALQAIQNGSHALIEKPMGLHAESCKELITEADRLGKHLFVVKQNRYSPPVKWMKDLVDDGALGDILQVQINCYWNRDDRYYSGNTWKGSLELDGGVLFTQFSHFIDIMHWVFGDVTNIRSRIYNHTHRENTEFADSGNAIFEFVNGGAGCLQFTTSTWDKNFESSITVLGSKGTIRVGGQYMNEVEYAHIENYRMPELPETNPPNDYGPFTGSAANHHYVIENVIETLNSGSSVTNAKEAMTVVDIIERIYAASEK